MHMPNIGAIKKSTFLTSNTKEIFNHLKQIFIKILILQHFDLKYHIRIKINLSGYVISGMLS